VLLPEDPAHAFVPYPAVRVPNAGEGPLAGLSFAAKDLFDVAGYPTGGGCPTVLAMSGVKSRTAPIVQRLLGAHGVLVMPTMPEVAPLLSADESQLEDYRNAAIRMLCIAGLAGFPQVSIPIARRLGAPLGLSLLSPASRTSRRAPACGRRDRSVPSAPRSRACRRPARIPRA